MEIFVGEKMTKEVIHFTVGDEDKTVFSVELSDTPLYKSAVVTWSENGVMRNVEYSVSTVRQFLTNGAWKRVAIAAPSAVEDTQLLKLLISKLEWDGFGYWLPEWCVKERESYIGMMGDYTPPPTLDEFREFLKERAK
jgi:hypothetical protein